MRVFWVWGLAFRGLGLRGLGFRVEGLGFHTSSARVALRGPQGSMWVLQGLLLRGLIRVLQGSVWFL